MNQHEENLIKARSELVVRYRLSSNPWPDGIDSKGDQWYNPEQWDTEGNYSGPKPMRRKRRKGIK